MHRLPFWSPLAIVVQDRRHKCRAKVDGAHATKPTTPTKLIVLLAFVRDEEGELQQAFEAREVPSEEKAKMDARRMAALGTYAGVITWSRTADLVNGVFGEPVVLFQHGDVPEME